MAGGSRETRRNRALRALAASGSSASPSPVSTTYDLAKGSLSERCFMEEAMKAGLGYLRSAEWPSDLASIPDYGEHLFREQGTIVFRLDSGAVVRAWAGHGWFGLDVAGGSFEQTVETIDSFQALHPPLYATESDSDDVTVPITFWTDGRFGPTSRLRMIDAASWEEIEGNYTAAVRDELSGLVYGFEPGVGGQLLLWQGPPGTGKSWALRALASEWRDWAEFNYITDPDAFFVTNPSYLIDVLLHESYEALTVEDDVVTSLAADGKWRVLVLEDTGELLSANAKEAYGQGLSRLLNVVDGMVGQGLRILVLITTNDELGDLHPAAVRPGRCASRIEFGPLTADEATAWMTARTPDGEIPAVEFEGGTLAELYARSHASVSEAIVEVDPEFDADFEEALALAQAPLDVDGIVASAVPVEDVVADLVAHADPERREELTAAFAALADVQRLSVDGIVRLVSANSKNGSSDDLTKLAMEAVIELAKRPPPQAPAAPDIHVHVPKQDLSVNVEGSTFEPRIEVLVPEQPPLPAPIVNVAAAEAPSVYVTVEKPDPASIEVHVPPQEAPEIHVHVPVERAPERPTGVRVEIDPETGEKRFVTEYDHPNEDEGGEVL